MKKKGGEKWRSGADTCVFKPAVKCAGEAAPREGISRILAADQATRDVQVETMIRERFPDLVNNGVSVHIFSCRPDFTAADILPAADYRESRGCSQLGELNTGVNDTLLNLITPEKIRTFFDVIKIAGAGFNYERRMKMLAPALRASVELVPDTGPWIIHADCHLNNIIVGEGKALLADWGRTIIIENPSDSASIQKGLNDWIDSIMKDTTPETRNFDFSLLVDRIADRYPQNPKIIMQSILSYLNLFIDGPPSAAWQSYLLEHLRGWVPYVLMHQVFKVKDANLLKCKTQEELRGRVEAYITAPPPEPLTTVALPPLGGRKTRRRIIHRRKSRRLYNVRR